MILKAKNKTQINHPKPFKNFLNNEPPRGKPRGIRGGVTASFPTPYPDFLHNAQPPSSPRVHLPSKRNIHQTKTPHPTVLSLVMDTA